MIFASNKSLGIEMRRAERTVQYHRHRILHTLRIGNVVRKRDTWDACPKCGSAREVNQCPKCGYRCEHAGHKKKLPSGAWSVTCPQFRRITTLELDSDRIASFRLRSRQRSAEPFSNFKQYQASPEYPGKKHDSKHSGHRSTSHASPSNEAAKQEAEPAKPALVGASGITRAKHREMQFRQRVGIRMAQLMRGVNRTMPPEGGMGNRLGPGDEGYVAPLTREEAECAVAREFGATPDEVADNLKLMRWRFAEEERKE